MSHIEFRLLGPVGAWHDGQLLGPTTPHQRTVLSLLLLDVNRIVPMEKMVRSIWGEKPTASSHNAVQGYISKLRRMLAPYSDCGIETISQGYRLRVDSQRVDLHRFRRLVKSARDTNPPRAGAILQDGLELWQGPPLTGVAGSQLVSAVTAHLEEERLSALETRAEIALRAGSSHEAITELSMLVVDHPLRERAAGLLMAALYESGRRADALLVFRDTRRHLVEALGVEPGSALHEVHRKILLELPNAPHRT